MDSCSNMAGKKEFPFISIETPGLNEPMPLKRFRHLFGDFRGVEFVNVFLIVFNGTSPRFDSSVCSAAVFGGDFKETGQCGKHLLKSEKFNKLEQ